MTAQSKAVIKSYFQTDDKPTQAQFEDLVDSYQDFGSTISNYYVDTGTANTYVITTSPPTLAYTDGMAFAVKIVNGNTGGCTLNAGAGAAQITYIDGTSLSSGTIPSDSIALFYYNSTTSSWMLVNILPTTGGNGITALTGDVTASGSGSVAATIASNAVTTAKIADNNVTLAKLATQAADTVLVNATSGAAVPTALALAASQLLGKGSSGNIAPIILGTGISMSGTTLNVATGGLVNVQFFTSNGTYTKTSGANSVLVFATGGGGGGGGADGNGGNGGASSFGAHCTGGGGSRGLNGTTGVLAGGAGGAGTGGSLNLVGGDGGNSVFDSSTTTIIGGYGGSSFLGGGGAPGLSNGTTDATATAGNNYGGGGGGMASSSKAASGGGGGGTAIKYITSGIGATETITIGAGGTAGTTGGAAGAAGAIIVLEFS